MTIKYIRKSLANKIQPTLEEIRGPGQTVAIKGRAIIENLQLKRDVIAMQMLTRSRQQ